MCHCKREDCFNDFVYESWPSKETAKVKALRRSSIRLIHLTLWRLNSSHFASKSSKSGPLFLFFLLFHLISASAYKWFHRQFKWHRLDSLGSTPCNLQQPCSVFPKHSFWSFAIASQRKKKITVSIYFMPDFLFLLFGSQKVCSHLSACLEFSRFKLWYWVQPDLIYQCVTITSCVSITVFSK